MKEHEWTLAQWLAAPRDLAQGFLGGLFGPLLALVGAVGLIYMVTKKLPAIKKVSKGDGTTQRALVLALPLEARASWARYGGEFRSAWLEWKAQAQQKNNL